MRRVGSIQKGAPTRDLKPAVRIDVGLVRGEVLWIYELKKEHAAALECYRECMARGYTGWAVQYNCALATECSGDIPGAKSFYEKAAEDSPEEKKSEMLLALGYYNMRIGEYERAREIARRLTENDPENYDGYHLMFLCAEENQSYAAMEQCFKQVRDRFKDHPFYWKERLFGLERLKRTGRVLALIDNDPAVMKTIPQDALQTEIRIYLSRGNKEKVRKLMEWLFVQYESSEAAFGLMVMACMDGKFDRAAGLAEMIIEAEKDSPGVLFYQTVYLYSAILIKLFDGKLPEEIRDRVISGVRICEKWFGETGLKPLEMDQTTELLINAVEGSRSELQRK